MNNNGLAGSLRARRSALLRLSHELGRDDLHLAILGEGNTSARLNDGRILVKASGSGLSALTARDLVECRSSLLLSLLDTPRPDDEVVDRTLLESRVHAKEKKPSVEVLFHAYLLTLPDVEFVGHAHPIGVNQVLCSPRAAEFAARRIFPDEVVCCGPESVFVPYTDPGHQLARALRKRTETFMKRHGAPPRVILLESHGIVTLGLTPEAVMAALLMAEKAAHLWVGAARLGGPTFMSSRDVRRIAGRSDEHYRRRMLNV